MAGAIALMKSVKVYRLGQDPVVPDWVDLTQKVDEDFTPVPWEDNLTYWEVLAELLDSEPPFTEYLAHYGDLAELAIARDATGLYLDGGTPYTLDVPQPVPAKLFLVPHRLRRAHPQRDPHQPEPGSHPVDVRTRRSTSRPASPAPLRTPATPRRRGGRHLDSGPPRHRLVRLFPYLRPRRTRLRRHLATT
jgi:hypothetical protein